MGDSIRSRRPIRSGQSESYNSSHGSPNRQNGSNLYPHLSGSEDDDDDVEQELIELEKYHPDSTTSLNTTHNSSSDVADCGGIQVSRSLIEKTKKYYPNGTLQKEFSLKITEKVSIPEKGNESHGSGSCVIFVVVLMLIAVAVAALYYKNHVDTTVQRPQLRCSFEQYVRDFPNQDKILWKSLEHGVQSVLNDIPTKPSIFLLAYEDIASAHKITRSIVKRTTECMDSKVNALVLSADDLTNKEMKMDYGVVIAKYQNQLKKSGVMLVDDLNKVPREVAPAFHVFCDVQNPLVDRSIIFLTLQLTGNSHTSSSYNTLNLVENYLRSNWSGVESYILDPLIVRVTDQVFVLNKE